MKRMKAGHTEDFRLPFFNCRSSIQPEPIKSLLVRAMQEEISSDALATLSGQGFGLNQAVPFEELGFENPTPDEGSLIRIHKEGLLG
jgi:hypothetical protein